MASENTAIVDGFSFATGTALKPTADGDSEVLGVAEFTFWNQHIPDAKITMRYVGTSQDLLQMGLIVYHGLRLLADRTKRIED